MGILNFLGGGIIGQVGKVIDSLHTSGEEKQQFELQKQAAKLEIEKLLQARDSEIETTIRAELSAKERVIVAEMQQGDNFTKRARPSIVYVGLGMMVINFTLIPLIGAISAAFGNTLLLEVQNYPEEFWWAWSGVVATWSIGRSMERRGVSTNLGRQAVGLITGNKQ